MSASMMMTMIIILAKEALPCDPWRGMVWLNLVTLMLPSELANLPLYLAVHASRPDWAGSLVGADKEH